MTKKLVIAGVVLAVLALVALAILLTWTWESPALTGAVLGALSSEELQVESASVKLKVLGGVVLDDVHLRTRLDGGTLDATARQLVLSHRPLGLLSGKVEVDEVKLVEPAIDILWDAPKKKGAGKSAKSLGAAAPPPAAPAEDDAGLALALGVDRIALERGRLVMREENVPGEMVRFEGLDLELNDLHVPSGAPSLIESLAARGTVKAERLTTPALVAQGVKGELTFAEGHVLVGDLRLPSEYGVIVVPRLDLDLGRDPYVFGLSVEGSPLATGILLGGAGGFGPSALRVELEGDGSPKGGPRGRGSLAIEEGTLGQAPILAALEKLLVATDLVGRPYQPFAIPFTLDGDFVDIQPFTVVAGNLSLAAYGRVDLNGPLNLHLEIALPRADISVKEIPAEVLEALTDVDGRVKLPILIAGTLDQPAVRFDSRAWGRLLGRRAVDEGLRWLSKKLGG